MRSIQWLSLWELESVTRVQILDKTVCVSYNANVLGKGINSSFHLWVESRANGILTLVRQPVEGRKTLDLNQLYSLG